MEHICGLEQSFDTIVMKFTVCFGTFICGIVFDIGKFSVERWNGLDSVFLIKFYTWTVFIVECKGSKSRCVMTWR